MKIYMERLVPDIPYLPLVKGTRIVRRQLMDQSLDVLFAWIDQDHFIEMTLVWEGEEVGNLDEVAAGFGIIARSEACGIFVPPETYQQWNWPIDW